MMNINQTSASQSKIEPARLSDNLSRHTTALGEPLPLEREVLSVALANKKVKDAILEAGDAIRARHPWLVAYQNTIGMCIFVVSCLAICTLSYCYIVGELSAWITIPLAAIFMSFLHELEHDLIHLMYFRKSPFWNKFMLIGVWVFRPSTINPLVRRDLHFHHYKYSGTESDLEERAITNCVPWGILRLLMVGDNFLSIYLRPLENIRMLKSFVNAEGVRSKQERSAIARKTANGYFPLGIVNFVIWHGFIVFWIWVGVSHLFGLTSVIAQPYPVALTTFLHGATIWVVCLSAPNAIRTFCLHFVSSNIHYYGDVGAGNVIQQCQVWTSKWVMPLHLFCFNFGATHAIHHFVVRDPFYIRQALANQVYPTMRQCGVRFNDFGTFARANRLGELTREGSI